MPRAEGEVTIEFVGGPLDGQQAYGEEPPADGFDASPPFGIGDVGVMLRSRPCGRRGPDHIFAEFLGYADDLDEP